MAQTLLKVDNINVFYGNIHAVKDVSFEVNEGEIVTLIGANGAGKSTTLKTISGLLQMCIRDRYMLTNRYYPTMIRPRMQEDVWMLAVANFRRGKLCYLFVTCELLSCSVFVR